MERSWTPHVTSSSSQTRECPSPLPPRESRGSRSGEIRPRRLQAGVPWVRRRAVRHLLSVCSPAGSRLLPVGRNAVRDELCETQSRLEADARFCLSQRGPHSPKPCECLQRLYHLSVVLLFDLKSFWIPRKLWTRVVPRTLQPPGGSV